MKKLVVLFFLLSKLIGLFAQETRCKNCNDSLLWKDTDGNKMVKVTVVQKGEIGTKNRDNGIYSTIYLKNNDSLMKINSIKEQAASMDAILYRKGSIKINDFDGDSIIESYF